MKNRILTELIKYAIAFAIMTGFLFLILGLRNYFTESLDLVTKFRYLTDAFTLPGALFILVATLVFLTNQGSLTALTWALKRFVRMLIPGMGLKNNQTYYEYVESRKKIAGYLFILISGAIFFIVGMVFLILFYTNYKR